MIINQSIQKRSLKGSAFLLSLCLLGVLGTKAQPLVWQNADSLYGPLPNGVHVYRMQGKADTLNVRAFYIELPLHKKSLRFDALDGKGQMLAPSEFYEQNQQPLVVVNGTFFSFSTRANLNLLMHNGRQLSYNVPTVAKSKKDSGQYHYITRSAIGINKKRRADVAWVYTDTSSRWPIALQGGPSTAFGPLADPAWTDLKPLLANSTLPHAPWKMKTAIGGGPALIHGGMVRVTNREERMFVTDEQARHPRTAMGYTADGRLIILVVEGRNPGVADGLSLTEEAQMLLALGCVEALNLDGGGSSCLLINGRETIRPSDKTGQRKIPGVFLIHSKK